MIIQISPDKWVNITNLESVEIFRGSDDECYLRIKDTAKTYFYYSAVFRNETVARSFAKSIITKFKD